MADKLKFTNWAEWDIEMRERAERERTDPVSIRIKATLDALDEQARIDGVKLAEEAASLRAKLEEEAEALFAAKVLAITTGRARATKLAKRASPEAKAAKAEALERRVAMVDAACDDTDRKPAQSALCLRDIRDHLPEGHGATDRELLEALGIARLRRIARSTTKAI